MIVSDVCFEKAPAPSTLRISNPTIVTLTLSWDPGNPESCEFKEYRVMLRRRISKTEYAEFTPLACTGLTSINDNSCTPLLSYPDTEYRSLSQTHRHCACRSLARIEKIVQLCSRMRIVQTK